MADISRKGFGQVEPNHLSGIVEGRIYAQLPADNTVFTSKILEQGMFAKYDMEHGKVNLAGDGEWLLVYNEEQKYDERYQMHKDYAMKGSDFIDDVMVPRLIATEIGDIYTTNTFGANTSNTATVTAAGIDPVVGTKFTVDSTTGYLKVAGAGDTTFIWKVVKDYTMPDGQRGVKLQRIA